MSYSPDQETNLIDKEIETLAKKITICQKVRDTLASSGWKDIIGPIIDRQIMDVVGGKIGDVWVSGTLSRARKDERREYWIGYKQALIDLHNRVMFHIDELKRNEESLKVLQREKDSLTRVPLIGDTRYNLEDNNAIG